SLFFHECWVLLGSVPIYTDWSIQNMNKSLVGMTAGCAALGCLLSTPLNSAAATVPFAALPGIQDHTITTIASTVPKNGDVNPYGMSVVSASTGSLVKGDILISNFNDSQNLQGTGT